jgi:hypothetical protein
MIATAAKNIIKINLRIHFPPKKKMHFREQYKPPPHLMTAARP